MIGLAGRRAAAFGVQVLLGRALPAGGLALVTVAVQFAFVASAGARFGMDVAAVRARRDRRRRRRRRRELRSLVDRCAGVAAVASGAAAPWPIAAASPLTGDRAGAIAIGAGRPAVHRRSRTSISVQRAA